MGCGDRARPFPRQDWQRENDKNIVSLLVSQEVPEIVSCLQVS